MKARKKAVKVAKCWHVQSTFSKFKNHYTACIKQVKCGEILFIISSLNEVFSSQLKAKYHICKSKN